MQKAHRKAELFVMIAYSIGHLIIGFFHEPWFDESLAWLIARDSSLYDILFVAPHYEGHPSLWHLVLLPFAKLGMPYGLSMCLVSLVFSTVAVAIFVYKAPFSRMIRLITPFTYFFFYQYSIINRPYCMMMLAFMLMALSYGSRNNRPGRFVLSLWFLCVTSAYGIVIAGGICISWLIEMFISAYRQSQAKNSENGESRYTFRIFVEDYLVKNGTVFWLLGLLVYVIFIICRLMPAENTYATVRNNLSENNSVAIRFLYTFFCSFSDLFLTNIYSSGGTLASIELPMFEFVIGILAGATVLGYVIYMMKESGKLFMFLVPYAMFALFGGIVYFSDSHIGILLLLLIYSFWTTGSYESKEKTENNSIKKITKVALAIGMMISLYWTVSSCVCDVIMEYGYGQKEAEFIKDNGLEDCSILAEWSPMYDEDLVIKDYTPDNPAFSVESVGLSAANPDLKIYNSPEALGTSFAKLHSVLTKEEGIDQIEKIEEIGIPDIIVGQADLSMIYGDSLNIRDYKLVYKENFGNIRKGVPNKTLSYIYIRDSIAEEKDLFALNYTD